VERNELLTLSVTAVVFVLGLTSTVIASAMTAETHFAGSVDTAAHPSYREARVTAKTDVNSPHNWAGRFEQRLEKEIATTWSPGRSALDRARQVLDSPRAGKVLAHCRARGMYELPEQAFEVSDRGIVPESSHGSSCNLRADFLVVPMRDPRGDRFATAIVYREDDGNVMAITIDTATNELTNVISPDGEEELTRFNRKKWADCFVTACGPCIAGCAFTGPLWLKCSAACCGVAAAVCVYIAMQD